MGQRFHFLVIVSRKNQQSLNKDTESCSTTRVILNMHRNIEASGVTSKDAGAANDAST
jgi:hypothetical protein